MSRCHAMVVPDGSPRGPMEISSRAFPLLDTSLRPAVRPTVGVTGARCSSASVVAGVQGFAEGVSRSFRGPDTRETEEKTLKTKKPKIDD